MFRIITPLVFEIYAGNIDEMFVYKHTETTEYVKKQPNFSEKNKLHGLVTRKFLELRI